MDQFATYLKAHGYRPASIDAYVRAVRQLELRAPELTDQALLAHKEWLIASFSPRTANNRIAIINVYLDYVGYEGLRLKSVNVQQKPFLDNVISNEEYRALKCGLKRDGELFWYHVVRFLACTGARVSELRQFEVSHLEAGYMDIISKGSKLRRIWIPDKPCREALAWCEEEGRSQGPLFPGANGKPMSARGIGCGLKRAAVAYGIDPDVVYPHSFRHLFAKNFIARNHDIAFLADLMGHESVETTRIYLRMTADEQRAAVDKAVNW